MEPTRLILEFTQEFSPCKREFYMRHVALNGQIMKKECLCLLAAFTLGFFCLISDWFINFMHHAATNRNAGGSTLPANQTRQKPSMQLPSLATAYVWKRKDSEVATTEAIVVLHATNLKEKHGYQIVTWMVWRLNNIYIFFQAWIDSKQMSELSSNSLFIRFVGFLLCLLLQMLFFQGHSYVAFFSLEVVWNADVWANLGKHNPNLVSMPANEATASLMPPMWSGCKEMSGLKDLFSLQASCTTALLQELK